LQASAASECARWYSETSSRLFPVRAALEGFAAKFAVDRLSQTDLRKLERAEARFARLTKALRTAAAGRTDAREIATQWVFANDEFHDVFIEAAGVGKLADAARAARRVFHGQAAWSTSAELTELYESNLDQHAAIVAAFHDRSSTARDLVEHHILDSARLLERALEDAGYGSAGSIGRRVSWASTSPIPRSATP
jgi:DNA-binding GntR family transcriptional regulator